MHTSGRCWGQWGRCGQLGAARWRALALQPAWAVLQAVYAVAGNMLPTAHPLETYTSVYPKCQVLSLHSIMISVSCTTQTLHLLSHHSPTQGHLCFKVGQHKCRLYFCHISAYNSSLSSHQTSPAAQQSCVPELEQVWVTGMGYEAKNFFFTSSQLKISER